MSLTSLRPTDDCRRNRKRSGSSDPLAHNVDVRFRNESEHTAENTKSNMSALGQKRTCAMQNCEKGRCHYASCAVYSVDGLAAHFRFCRERNDELDGSTCSRR